MQIIAYFPDKRKEENKMEKMIDVLELEDNIAEVEAMVDKVRFLLTELDEYDLVYEVTPYKAIEYARNEKIFFV